jgi:energy-coupling factor transporter ATP-binding protein EcfA2
MKSSPKNPKSIVSVAVDRLFGDRSYVVQTDSQDLSKLLILYGDNGSGKTTILRMIYSLLSPARKGGFKTFLSKTPFASFSVTFADGTTMSAVRPPGEVLGSFELALTYANGSSVSIALKADADLSIKQQGEAEERRYDQFLTLVRNLGIALYYLSDDRRLQTIHLPESAADQEEEVTFNVASGIRVFHERIRDHYTTERLVFDEREPRGVSLQPTVYAFETWARKHALRASTVGEGNANTIYTDLIRSITSAYQRDVGIHEQPRLEELRVRLMSLAERSITFTRLGLMSPPQVTELTAALDLVGPSSQLIVRSVLEPYVRGLEVRISALQELHDSLTTFLGNLNELYRGKRVEFNLREGLKILTPDGRLLNYESLSSGEKQLLVLLCNTLIARDQTSIFVIDEPELSLNVKWQRSLVRTLLECVAGTAVQFVLATHSIELLSAYDNSVVHLQPVEWPLLNAAQSTS